MDRPLSGLKVVELARILAGPWAGQLLDDPQVIARGRRIDRGGIASPIVIDGRRPVSDLPSPCLVGEADESTS
jgi:crotonobetainyl-CoA:carnitine CoA-transferase CaiB-like acyl-CoA transferase